MGEGGSIVRGRWEVFCGGGEVLFCGVGEVFCGGGGGVLWGRGVFCGGGCVLFCGGGGGVVTETALSEYSCCLCAPSLQRGLIQHLKL